MAACPEGYRRTRQCVEKKATATTRHRQFRQVFGDPRKGEGKGLPTADYAKPSKYGRKYRKADLKENSKGRVVSRKLSDASKRAFAERSDDFKEAWDARKRDMTQLDEYRDCRQDSDPEDCYGRSHRQTNRRLRGGKKRPECPTGVRVTQVKDKRADGGYRDLKEPYVKNTRPMMVCTRFRKASPSKRGSKVSVERFMQLARVGDIWKDEEGKKFKVVRRRGGMKLAVQSKDKKGAKYDDEVDATFGEGTSLSRVSKAKKGSKKSSKKKKKKKKSKKPKKKSSGKKKKKKKKPSGKKKKKSSDKKKIPAALKKLQSSQGFMDAPKN